MKAAQLLDKYFETAFTAPDGIKRLRELILTLAMQGKLVPQDPNDQPARELLKEIEAEKKRLIKEEGLKTKAKEKINSYEEYMVKPPSWQFCRLGNLAKFIDYRGKTPKKVGKGITLITAKNVRFGFINKEPYEYITEEEFDIWMTRGFPKVGDLLFTTEAPLGNIAIIDIQERFALAQRVICFQLHKLEIATFLRWFIMSNIFRKQLIENATGMTAKGIRASRLKEIPIPIPPLEEQRRIVEKVNHLMEQVDRLEKLQGERDRKRLIIHKAASDRLLNAPDKNSFNQAWSFIQKNFNELYSVKENISELRKAILQLAVMGKLVPQDPNDPPASELLKEIEVEKKRLIQEKKIKKSKPLPEIKPYETPYDLPKSWEWTKLNNLLIFGPTNGFSPKAVEYETPVRSLTLSATTSGQFKGEYSKFIDCEIPLDSDLWLRDRDILIQRGNTLEYVGVSAIYRGNSNCYIYPDLMMKIRVSPKLDTEYINLSMSSKKCRDFLRDRASGTSGTMPKINQKTLISLPIPIPPLPEQHRIVAKVNQLMAMCDLLEEKSTKQTEKQSKLLQAVLAKI